MLIFLKQVLHFLNPQFLHIIFAHKCTTRLQVVFNKNQMLFCLFTGCFKKHITWRYADGKQKYRFAYHQVSHIFAYHQFSHIFAYQFSHIFAYQFWMNLMKKYTYFTTNSFKIKKNSKSPYYLPRS